MAHIMILYFKKSEAKKLVRLASSLETLSFLLAHYRESV